MSVDLHWFLPTAGDGRGIVDNSNSSTADPRTAGNREPTLEYLTQVARAAEHAGFTGVLTPTGTHCEDAWLTTAALIPLTERLKFLVAFRPGVISPVLAAQMAASYQRLSGGRLLLNVVTGGDSIEQQSYGDWLTKDQRYARTGEFLQALRGTWGEAPFDFDGEHYRLRGATTSAPPNPLPPIYFGGSSAAALPVAGAHADVYLTWGEPPAAVSAKIAAVREHAERAGRTIRFGIRLHVITRDTSADAWAVTERMLAGLDPDAIADAAARFANAESEGQRRMTALHGGSTANLEIAPNLWAGVGLVRGGAGTALVGSHTEVADRIEEYHDLGIDEFVLSGYPHVEEAYWFGEGVRPILARRGLLSADRTPANL
ncbi:LLM class flavin-dependent oxidoreductase [Rhodococcus sp. NPDC127528]|uniref:LLM class flavin-dependent oxidoreductase n=1 Tax=unclassified Rhodococcus (in: high G+C Gram-positive bacteria) TaxID=192944 RepID=UPI003625EA7A